MADTKISALTALTGANLADADLHPVVDIVGGTSSTIGFGIVSIYVETDN